VEILARIPLSLKRSDVNANVPGGNSWRDDEIRHRMFYCLCHGQKGYMPSKSFRGSFGQKNVFSNLNSKRNRKLGIARYCASSVLSV